MNLLGDAAGPADQVSILKLGMKAYDQYLAVNPSALSDESHRRRYTYLALLLSQSLSRVGTLPALRESAQIPTAPLRFYAEQEIGSVVGYDPVSSVALVKLPETQSPPPLGSQFSLISAPEDALNATATRLGSFADQTGLANCNTLSLAIQSGLSLEGFAICGGSGLVAITSGTPSTNAVSLTATPAPAFLSFVRGLNSDIMVVGRDLQGTVLGVWSLPIGQVPTLTNFGTATQADIAQGGWKVSISSTGATEWLQSDLVLWKQQIGPGSNALEVTKATSPGSSLKVALPAALTVIDDPYVLPSAAIPTYVIVGSATGGPWHILSASGEIGTIARGPSREIAGALQDIVLIADRSVAGETSFEAYRVSSASVDRIDCVQCAGLKIALFRNSPAYALAMRGTAPTLIYAADSGMKRLPIATNGQITSMRGPAGLPLRVSSLDPGGAIFGAAGEEIVTWRTATGNQK